MTMWSDAILSMCGMIKNEEDVLTILDIAVDNGILGTISAIKIAKQFGIEWKPENLPTAGAD